jgi:hypothetical protein
LEERRRYSLLSKERICYLLPTFFFTQRTRCYNITGTVFIRKTKVNFKHLKNTAKKGRGSGMGDGGKIRTIVFPDLIVSRIGASLLIVGGAG